MVKKKINYDEIEPMTVKEAKKFFGKALWSKMKKSPKLDGVTCILNEKGEIILYALDLYQAYKEVIGEDTGYWD